MENNSSSLLSTKLESDSIHSSPEETEASSLLLDKDSGLKKMDEVAFHASLLSGIEVGLGSVLHSFRVPMTGQFLSLNQGFLLARAVRQNQDKSSARFLPIQISNIAALLKALSPSGKKLTPMLALSAQGLLFNLGVTFFGTNLLGLVTGMVFLSLWAFIQPVLVYYILFGKTLFFMLEFWFQKLREFLPLEKKDVLYVLLGYIGIKVILAMVIGFLAYYLPESVVAKWQRKLLIRGPLNMAKDLSQAQRTTFKNTAFLAMKDLCNPLFLFTFLLTGVFFYFARSSYSETLWVLLRPLAIGFLVFFLVRLFPFDDLLAYLNKTRFHRFSRALHESLEIFRKH